MPKKELIDAYHHARALLLDAIEGLSEDAILQAGAVGYWSVKDVLAHLTAWESELVTALVRIEHKQKGVPKIVEIEDIDAWNQEQYHISASRDLNIVLSDFHGVSKHLIAAIEALDDKSLDDNRVFPWMEGEPLAYLVYENAIWHEEEHANDILDWRESTNDGQVIPLMLYEPNEYEYEGEDDENDDFEFEDEDDGEWDE